MFKAILQAVEVSKLRPIEGATNALLGAVGEPRISITGKSQGEAIQTISGTLRAAAGELGELVAMFDEMEADLDDDDPIHSRLGPRVKSMPPRFVGARTQLTPIVDGMNAVLAAVDQPQVSIARQTEAEAIRTISSTLNSTAESLRELMGLIYLCGKAMDPAQNPFKTLTSAA